MNFAIGYVEYFESLGFNTEHWRKSLDGTLAIVHAEFAEVLCDNEEIDIYAHNDPEFIEIINGRDWVEQPDEEEMGVGE